jgi:hypothetical protein
MQTFKLICREQAQELFNARHNIYVSYDTYHGIELCYVDPDLFRPALKPTFYITTELYNKLMSNKRTPQQAFIDSKPAQDAWLAGKQLQWSYPDKDNDWYDCTGGEPRFMDPRYIWRPKPEPEKVPFTQLTVPDAWFRRKDYRCTMWIAHTISETAIHLGLGNSNVSYKYLAEHFEYSHDRINWKPCYELKNT